MRPTNMMVILSDEHARGVLGCHGHGIVRTPNLDRLARAGTRFTQAYTPSPICAPARASFATGRYVHEHHCWDQAHPYHGQLPAWGHHLKSDGHRVVSVGKNHFRSVDDDNGFSIELLPMHLHNGVGDLLGLQRNPPAARSGMKRYALDVGPGESPYTRQDRGVADACCAWLREQAPKCERPWVLYAGFVLPHFPLFAPPEFWGLYPPEAMPMPRLYAPEDAPTHPVLKALRDCWCYDDHFDEESVRRTLASYYAVVSFLDDNIGRILKALDDCGFRDNTRVLYSSDHGDTLGNRRMWGKSTMYEESVGVPMIMAGPDVPVGHTISVPTSLVDVYPTIIEGAGGTLTADEEKLPGRSLIRVANGNTPERAVLAEYHGAGAITGFAMVRIDRWKYVHYVDHPPQLFDLDADPGETADLGLDAGYTEVVARCETELRRINDPEATNERAFRDQAARIAEHGGVAAIEKASRELQELGFTPPPEDIPPAWSSAQRS